METTPRCAWTNRRDPGTREIELAAAAPRAKPVLYAVCPEHEAKVRGYHQRTEQARTGFLTTVVLVLIGTPLALVLLAEDFALAVVCGGLGIALVGYPFATPRTVQANGIARSILLVRTLGVLLILFGAVFLFLAMR